MSKMSAFYAKVMSDEGLRSKAGKIMGNTEITAASDKQLTELGTLAREAGFDISLAEAKEYIAAGEFDLAEEALSDVAGGVQKGHFTCSGGGSAGQYDQTSPDLKAGK